MIWDNGLCRAMPLAAVVVSNVVGVSKARSRLFVVVLGFHAAFDRVSDSARGDDCHERHSPLLIVAERLVERLPGIGDLLEVGRTLTERLRPALHEFDGIALVKGFH